VEGLNSAHLRALLAYLAVEQEREHPREQVAALLWPERSDRDALDALRYALSHLHRALLDRQSARPFVLVSRTHLQFNPTSDCRLDLTDFQQLSSRSDISSLEQAARLYRGTFLNGLSIADSPAFDEWTLFKGEELQRSALSMLESLTTLHMTGSDPTQARRWARRQLELDPYRERAHRQMMSALALGGERSAAIAHYEACRRLLADELGCEPEDETQALYARIRDGALLQPRPAPRAPATSPGPDPTGFAAVRFVARAGELAKLESLLDQALAGRGGVALISGEAGGGKTALLDEFSRQSSRAHPDSIALRGRCNAHAGAGDPYLPFREILQTLAGDVEGKRAGGTLTTEQTRNLWEALPAVGTALVEHGPDLIDSFVPGVTLLQRMEGFSTSSGARQWLSRLREIVNRTNEGTPATQPDLFAQVTQVLHTISASRPLILTIDDLQWADGGTAALLFHLGRRLAGSRILVICTYRPEAFTTGQESHATERSSDSANGTAPGIGAILRELVREWGEVRIDLDRADGRAFIEAYIDGEPNCLGTAFRQALYDHTGGNPLFTVELLRSFQRQGMLVQDGAGCWVETPGLDWNVYPAQVEVVIAGNLADLPEDELALLQVAAVQGEQFIAEVAFRILGLDERSAIRLLSGSLSTHHRLVGAVSLERLASTGQRLSHYRFRHSLIHRSAYNSLDVVERAQLHEATGLTLESIYTADGDKPQGLAAALAWQYEAAGLHLAAGHALLNAGNQATRLSAFRQALNLFDHGLALLSDEQPSPDRNEMIRLLEAARLGPKRNLEGMGSTELAGAWQRAIEAGAGEAQGRVRLLTLEAEADLLVSRGQFQAALSVAESMLGEAFQSGDEAFMALAHWFFGFVSNLKGRPLEAESHFNWNLDWLTPQRRAELLAASGYDILADTLAFSAVDLWFLGYPEQARLRSAQAVTSALELGDLFGQACTSAIGCTVLFLLRSDEAALLERSQLCRRLTQQHSIAMWQQYAEVFLGRLAIHQGEDRAGIEHMQRAIAAWQAMGMAIGTDSLVMVMADGCLAAVQRLPGTEEHGRLGLLAPALAAIEPLLRPEVPCGQSYQAELHRLKGELLLERDGLAAVDEALECFEQSLQLGLEMGALAWELRAAMSLVRLRKCQGNKRSAELGEARKLLHNLYERFTEGFDFPDLQDAAALISETG
jgi:DNA-binding SARP family transcriptional activator/tetratricopeptide (TPR) repeat protein